MTHKKAVMVLRVLFLITISLFIPDNGQAQFKSVAFLDKQLQAYRANLQELRQEHQNRREMPDLQFYLFGMGDRRKMIYQRGVLKDARSGEIIRQWPVKAEHYPTGTSSWGEHFQGDYELCPDGEVHGDKYESAGEGCVTVTWLQMNWHLLRFTGEPKYADELERITFNGLLGAQSPQDGTVCYFIPLTGRKRFAEVNHGILPDVSCCASSIPRGIALIPQFIAGSLHQNQAVVWQYIPGNYPIQVKTAKENLPVELRITTAYPQEGSATININLPPNTRSKAKFAVQLRVPEWCSDYQAKVGSETFTGKAGQLLSLNRTWQSGDQIQVTLSMDLRTVTDAAKGSEGVIVARGPQVLTADDRLDTVGKLPQGWVGDQFYKIKGKVNGKETILRMVPFAEAGQTQGHYQVIQPKIIDLTYVK